MMFLEFFIWGAWFVTMGSYLTGSLGFSGADSALAYSHPVMGRHHRAVHHRPHRRQIRECRAAARRNPCARRGADVLLASATEFAGFYPYLLLYMILYMPTLALVNAISFRQMDDPARHFGNIRVWGTVGWIVAGLTISYVFAWDSQAGLGAGLLRNTFTMAAVASLVLGVFSFTLPPRRRKRAAPAAAYATPSVSTHSRCCATGIS